MIDSFYIALKYISYNKIKTVTLVACITLIAVLPLSLRVLLGESERQLTARAESTPLLVGARGSALDLVMSSLYFDDEPPEPISMQAAVQILDSGLASPIPLYVRFRARGYAIVGTTLDYFDYRKLNIADGNTLSLLGDCVLGADAAGRLGLGPGDSIVSSPENLFDLAGVYPLKMNIAGVLEKTYTTDDIAIFVDVKTAWIIEGLAHGHEDLRKTGDSSVILEQTDSNITANAKLMQYTEITEANIDSFHFHGDSGQFPITAVIALPHDDKSGTILQGRYLSRESTLQILRPKDVIDGLLENIFRIRNVLDSVILVVGLATCMAILLVFALSLRLRQREIETIFKLGCSRRTIARLLAAEIFFIVLISGVICSGLVMIVNACSNELVRALIIR